MPVLLVGGGMDLQITKDNFDALAKAAPSAQQLWIKDMDHVLRARHEISRSFLGVETLDRQGATSEEYRAYASEEQRRQSRCIGGENDRVISRRALKVEQRSPEQVRALAAQKMAAIYGEARPLHPRLLPGMTEFLHRR